MPDFTPEEVIAKVAAGDSLEGADLEGVDLQGAKLKGADLKGADLHYAKLGSVNFRKAAYNKSSKFPNGFDPEKVGMMFFGE